MRMTEPSQRLARLVFGWLERRHPLPWSVHLRVTAPTGVTGRRRQPPRGERKRARPRRSLSCTLRSARRAPCLLSGQAKTPATQCLLVEAFRVVTHR